MSDGKHLEHKLVSVSLMEDLIKLTDALQKFSSKFGPQSLTPVPRKSSCNLGALGEVFTDAMFLHNSLQKLTAYHVAILPPVMELGTELSMLKLDSEFNLSA